MDDTDPGMEMAGGGGWGQLPEDSSGSLDTAQGWGLTSAAPLCLPACSQQWLASLSHWRPATRGGLRDRSSASIPMHGPNITLCHPAQPQHTQPPQLSHRDHPPAPALWQPSTHNVQQESRDSGGVGQHHEGLSRAKESPMQGVGVAGEQGLPAGPEVQLHGAAGEVLLQLAERGLGWHRAAMALPAPSSSSSATARE